MQVILKTNTPKDCVLKNRVRERKETKETKNTESIWKENIIKRSIKNVFKLNKENEAIKDQIIRDIGYLSLNDYYKLIRVAISGTAITLNMEVTVIKIKTNQ